MHYTLTVYQSDDETPLFEVGTAQSHPHPYLHAPGEMDVGEIDLLAGKAMIGQINLRVIDPQTGPTQAERFLTALLGIPAGQEGAGHSAWNGHRGVLRQVGGRLVMDGVIWGVQLSDSAAGLHLQLRDVRERSRKLPLFERSGTSSVLPRGVAAGYGRIPGRFLGLPVVGWLVPPTKPLRATVQRFVSAGHYDLLNFNFYPHHWELRKGKYYILPHLVQTSAILDATRPQVVGSIVRCPDVTILWRLEGASKWEEIRAPIPAAHGSILRSNDARVVIGGEEHVLPGVTGIEIDRTRHADLPAVGSVVEVVLRYDGPPTEDYPFHFEGTAGELLRNVYRGDYLRPNEDGSPAATGIRYDEAALLRLTTPVRLRLTEPVKDARDWTEKIYKALGAAPSLDAEGRISPVLAALPPTTAVLPEIHAGNAQAIPGWDHPADRAVTSVVVKYQRDYLVRATDDPLGERSAGDGIASREIEAVLPAEQWVRDLVGDHPHEIDGLIYRALGGSDGDPVTGDAIDEAGAQASRLRGVETLDRWLFGGQTSFCRVRTAEFPDLREGDWVIDARPWRPNYRLNQRGGQTLAQVVSVRVANPVWLELRLIDAGPLDQPLNPPAIGALVATETGGVSVPVTSVPAGAEAAVYYAIADTQPGTTSGLWTYAGRVDAPGTIETPPVPAGARLYARARSEAAGRRPSAWTAVRQITLPSTPRVTGVRTEIDDTGAAVIRWEPNPHAAGVRIYYAVYDAGDSPSDPLVSSIDRQASALSAEIPVEVGARQVLTSEVEPWTGWSGSAVSGTPGDRVAVSVASNRRPDVEIPDIPQYAECQARVIASDATTVTIQVDGTPGTGEVYLYGLTKATRISGPGLGVPVPASAPAAQRQWVLSRPAFGAGLGEAVFRAEAPGYQSDDDHVVIADQGRDTIGLLMRARVQSVTASQVVVRVAVADPIDPTRPGAITITPQQVGTGGVSPSTAQTIAASAVRSDIDATGYIDFTLTRATPGSGSGRVVFTASRAGRVSDADAVDVPEMPPVLVLYTECLARVTAATATEITVTVDATPATAQVELLASSTAQRIPSGGGPNPGVKSPRGSVWKFQRPNALTNPLEALFRATALGYESDDQGVLIVEQGRDTTYLLMQARIYSRTATTMTIRVVVADPIDPQRTGNVTLRYTQIGTGGVTPSATRTIAAANIRADLAASEAADGYVDYVVTRPAGGAGPGRVDWRASRAGRVDAIDAQDVQDLPLVIPTCEITLESSTATVARYRIKGLDWQGGTTGLQYRHAYHWSHTPFTGWPTWQPLPVAGTPPVASVLIEVPIHAKWETIIGAQVRDSAQRVSVDAWRSLGASVPAIDDDTGLIDPVRPLKGGKLIEDQGGSQFRADEALAYSYDEMFDRGLRVDGYRGTLGGPGGLDALQVAQQVQQPSQNLLGQWAGRYVTTAGQVLGEESLSAMRLVPDDTISISTSIRRASGGGSPQIYIDWRQGTSTISTVTVTSPSADWRRIGGAGLVIPAGTTSIRLRCPPPTGGGTVEVGEWMCNRGPIALPFEESPLRPGRGDEGRAYHSFRAEGLLNPAAMASGNTAHTLITAGKTFQAHDGETVVFANYGPGFNDTPAVIPGAGGIAYHPDLSHPHGPVILLEDLSAIGFKLRARLEEAVGTTSPKSASFTHNDAAGPLYWADKVETPAAYNDVYTYRYSVSLAPMGIVTAEFWVHDGTKWIMVDTETYANGDPVNTLPIHDLTKSIARTNMNRTGRIFGMDFREPPGSSGSYVTPGNVSWGVGVAPNFRPMTPDGAFKIHFMAVGKGGE